VLLPYGDRAPTLEGPCFIAPGAHVIGDVRIGEDASIWFNAVLRGDGGPIVVGSGSNLQDGVVVHTDPGLVCRIGREVTVGHRAVLHGCEIGDHSLVGMGAIVLNGARVGEECLIGAGAVVPEGSVIPAGHLVLGVPGRVVRSLTDAEKDRIRAGAAHYIQLWKEVWRESGWQ
jgi:carbonic anhydrase/acetyltransferase-like protein (isoleucine patch superfamily)